MVPFEYEYEHEHEIRRNARILMSTHSPRAGGLRTEMGGTSQTQTARKLAGNLFPIARDCPLSLLLSCCYDIGLFISMNACNNRSDGELLKSQEWQPR